MHILDRELIDPFPKFWDRVSLELDIELQDIELASDKVFVDLSNDARKEQPEWLRLPDEDLAYHVAHEVGHVLLRCRGYPRIMRGKDYPPSSAEAMVGGDLEEMVPHVPIRSILGSFGFSNEVIMERMYDGAFSGLSLSPVPDYGSPWFFTWAIRYVELSNEMRHSKWIELKKIYHHRSRDVEDLGKELKNILESFDIHSPWNALQAMLACRDHMGLGVDQRVMILDPRSGEIQ